MPFRAKAHDGSLSFGPIMLKRWEQWLHDNDGHTVVITEEKPERSNQQNRYYWVYLGVIERETGELADDLHQFFKRKLLPPVFKTIRGESIKLPASTSDLGKVEFTDYLDKIAAMTEIALPDPIAAGYLPH